MWADINNVSGHKDFPATSHDIPITEVRDTEADRFVKNLKSLHLMRRVFVSSSQDLFTTDPKDLGSLIRCMSVNEKTYNIRYLFDNRAIWALLLFSFVETQTDYLSELEKS